MKIYLATFYGFFLGGGMLIVDETKRKAFNQAKKKLEEIGLGSLNTKFSIDDLEEIDVSSRQCIVFDDGDYC